MASVVYAVGILVVTWLCATMGGASPIFAKMASHRLQMNFRGKTGLDLKAVHEAFRDLEKDKLAAAPACNCSGDICSCCQNLVDPQFPINATFCVNVEYYPSDNVITLVLYMDDTVVLFANVSASYPPVVCGVLPNMKFLAYDCLGIFDLSEQTDFSGCFGMSLLRDGYYTGVNLGCFKLSLEEAPVSGDLKESVAEGLEEVMMEGMKEVLMEGMKKVVHDNEDRQ